jgi:integrase
MEIIKNERVKMSIFKRKSKNRTTSKNYSIRFKDHNGVCHIVAGFASKRATEGLESRILELVSCKVAGINLSKEIEKWVSDLPQPILKNLVKYGLIDNSRVSGAVSANKHIECFKQHLIDKGCSKDHIGTIIPRIYKIIKNCNITNINDLRIERISRLIADMSLSEQTRKHYHRHLKQFSRWLYLTGRTSRDLLHKMHIPKVTETVRPRRSLRVEEVSMLVKTTINSDIAYRGINGYERYLIYRLAIETGLRANEIRTLNVGDLDFENNTLNIKPKNEKARRGASLPLDISLSNLLKEFSSTKLPTAKIFNVPERTSTMLQIDLRAAGIEYKTTDGYVDFHSLRHTFGTLLALSGTKPQVAQMLMRHSDPRLTQNLYTHLTVSDAASARKFPDLSELYRDKINVG